MQKIERRKKLRDRIDLTFVRCFSEIINVRIIFLLIFSTFCLGLTYYSPVKFDLPMKYSGILDYKIS